MSQVISEKAKKLLLTGEEGEIGYMQYSTIGRGMERDVYAGSETLTDGTPRSAAEWYAALEELENGGYVTLVSSSKDGRRYRLSDVGYRKIDEIKAEENTES